MANETPAVREAADALFAAWRNRAPLETLAPWLADDDIEGAYAIQAALHRRYEAAGRRQVGWKVGVTSRAALAAFKSKEPMLGALYADALIADGGSLDPAQALAPRLEGEVLVELSARAGEVDPQGERIADAVASIRPAFEIVESRIAGWPRSIVPAIADNACCGWFAPAAGSHTPDGFDDVGVAMTMTADGAVLTQGTGADCLGGVYNSVRWFLAHARQRGLRLAAGQWLLTGALGVAVPAPPAGDAEVALGGLGAVRLRLGPA